MESHFLIPDWPVPPSVKTAVTLRSGGGSKALYDSNNLAMHVGDSEKDVIDNRTRLKESLALPSAPCWLDQYHSTEVIDAAAAHGTPRADASVSRQAATVCAVLTADCLPVLLCNRQGNQVAAAHAGWRGLCGGILRKTVATFYHAPTDILAYLGPAIGPQVFEVGAEVLDAFLANSQGEGHKQAIRAAFDATTSARGKYLADLYQLARAELNACGVQAVYGGDHCTYSEPRRFFSYRRDPVTGRNASLIWLI
jgi:YfiH family protein